MCTDGVHPNEEGYKYLAESTSQEINSYDMLDKWIHPLKSSTHLASF